MLDTVQFSSSIEEREEEEGTFVLHVHPSPVSLTSNQLKNFIGLLPLSQHIFLLPPLFLSTKSWDHLVLFVVSFILHPFCRCLSAKPSLPATPSLFSFCPLYCCASLPLSSLSSLAVPLLLHSPCPLFLRRFENLDWEETNERKDWKFDASVENTKDKIVYFYCHYLQLSLSQPW